MSPLSGWPMPTSIRVTERPQDPFDSGGGVLDPAKFLGHRQIFAREPAVNHVRAGNALMEFLLRLAELHLDLVRKSPNLLLSGIGQTSPHDDLHVMDGSPLVRLDEGKGFDRNRIRRRRPARGVERRGGR